MKKLFAIVLAFTFVFAYFTQSVQAGGGKVIGDKAAGPAVQNGECPFVGPSF